MHFHYLMNYVSSKYLAHGLFFFFTQDNFPVKLTAGFGKSDVHSDGP